MQLPRPCDNALASLPEDSQDTTQNSTTELTSLMSLLQIPIELRSRSASRGSCISDSAEDTEPSCRDSDSDSTATVRSGSQDDTASDGHVRMSLPSLSLSTSDDGGRAWSTTGVCGFYNTSGSLDRSKRKKQPSFNSDRRRQRYTQATRAFTLKRPPGY